MSIDIRNHARIMMMKEVARVADGLAEKSKSLGEKAEKCFGEKHKSQIRGLENIANSTIKVTDVKDYIKKQTGKHKEWRRHQFGTTLLGEVEALSLKAGEIRGKLEEDFKEHDTSFLPSSREIHILLIRELVKQVSAHYLYALAKEVV